MFGNKIRHAATAAKNTITVSGTTGNFFFSRNIKVMEKKKKNTSDVW